MPCSRPRQKLYCYIDETGQDTRGSLFIVSVIVTAEEREPLRQALERIERLAKKGRRKWTDSREQNRMEYMREVLTTPACKGKLMYAVYRDTTDYLGRTVLAVAHAIPAYTESDYEATVFVDGLPKSQTRLFGSMLRRFRIRTKKVRGVRKEQADALMRLADALCGFIRAAVSGESAFSSLLDRGKAAGYVREV